MDAGMNCAGVNRAVFASVLWLVASSAASAAFAQALRDPTRPPSAALTERGREGEARGSGGEGGMVLQSVIVSDGRRLALIDGRTYTVGDKIGEAKLISISGSEVTLRESGGRKVLRLTPNATKTTPAPEGESEAPSRASGAQARARGQK